jgi:hypothetical protein
MICKRILPILFSVLVTWGVAGPAQAQNEADVIEAVRAQISANRKALVAANLELTEEEIAGFWPLYREFHNETDALMDRRMAMLIDFRDNFGDLSDEKSRQIIDDYFRIQEDLLKVRKKYAKKFGKVLSDQRTLRYLQIESKMDAIIDSELTQIVPLAE